MAWFDQDFLDFFAELKENNNKDWFDLNRKRYEKSIKNPFKEFVSEMILRINSDDSSVVIEPKNAIFRINRDVRFSNDKTPYKIFTSALINSTGKKDKANPGIYFELSEDRIAIYGGIYQVDKDTLYAIRSYIAENIDEFNSVIEEKEFKSKFGNIQGEKHKRIPKEFQEIAKNQILISNKQFYYTAELDPSQITSEQLADTIMEYYYSSKPVKEFLSKAYRS